ncbi:metalloregulator ArsR/SmtB family transcription factor, partial [Streptomyces sp. NPDC006265]|uniref:ArsR/SmtB family transcription factor n=1 Tax=Streptomyces sp. NPDC006265 TaxID=3156740 RepID=UPI0033B7BC24
MGHGAVTPVQEAAERVRLDADNVAKVATTLQALSTPSRLLILARLREGPLPATELAAEVGMEQSACSHQLRLLRNLGPQGHDPRAPVLRGAALDAAPARRPGQADQA